MQKQASDIRPGFVEALPFICSFWEETFCVVPGDSVHPPGWTFPLKPCQSNDFICCFVLLMFPQGSGAGFGFVLSNPSQEGSAWPLKPPPITSLQGKDLSTQVFYKLLIRNRGNESCLDPTGAWREFPLSWPQVGSAPPALQSSALLSQSSVKIKDLCFSASGNVYGDYIFQLEIWRIRFLLSDMISVAWSQEHQGYVWSLLGLFPLETQWSSWALSPQDILWFSDHEETQPLP